jgi:hypothetical protein
LVDGERVPAAAGRRSITTQMNTFEFFIQDDRYTVPTFELVHLRDAERARELAAQRLCASLHHQSIEVRMGSERLFLISRSAPSKGSGEAHGSVV